MCTRREVEPRAEFGAIEERGVDRGVGIRLRDPREHALSAAALIEVVVDEGDRSVRSSRLRRGCRFAREDDGDGVALHVGLRNSLDIGRRRLLKRDECRVGVVRTQTVFDEISDTPAAIVER